MRRDQTVLEASLSADALGRLADAQEHIDHYTRMRDRRIIEALESGCSFRAVGRAVGLTAGAIHARRRRAG